MFGLATAALAVGVSFGWTGPTYKIFYLFGAVLNIPYLALGSTYLVIGPRTGRFVQAILAVFTLVAVLVIGFAETAASFPSGSVPEASEMFLEEVPANVARGMAIIAGAAGGSLIIGLGVASIFRFWRSNRRIVMGNVLIVAGTLAAAAGGSRFATSGEATFFVLTLLVAVVAIWGGYRVSAGARRSAPRSA